MKLKRIITIAFVAALSAAALPASSAPRPPLPPFLLPPIPDIRALIPVPRTEVYIAPDVDADLVFFDGYWWARRDGGWYRSRDYRREFVAVPPGFVPPPLLKLRPDFRDQYRRHRAVPYEEWRRRHWRPEWDRDRPNEWERRGDGDRHDRGRHRGEERGRDRDHDRGDRDDRGRGRD